MAKFILVLLLVGLHSVKHADSRIIAEVEPDTVEVSSKNSSVVTITCRVHQDTPVRKIFLIQILKKYNSKDDFIPIAEFELDRISGPAHFVQNSKIPRDIKDRFRVFGYQAPSLVDSYIQLETNSSTMLRSDGGHYQCKLVYQTTTSHLETQMNETVLTVIRTEKYSNGETSRTRQGTSGLIIMVLTALCAKTSSSWT